MTVMSDTLLCIDDDADFISTLQMSLELQGYAVVTTQNPITGWKEMERCQPDILLIDWEMPGMSGIEFVKMMKEDSAHRDRYIIMVTGRTGTESVVEGLDAGADDYLIKPFHIEELLARIRTGIRFRELKQRIAEEAKRLTVLEMALSIADKIGNPIAAAKLFQQMLVENPILLKSKDTIESLNTLGDLLSEALLLIDQYQSIKKPRSIPAPGGKTMIAPE
jgi:DNA-binding response OmpR family regulator